MMEVVAPRHRALPARLWHARVWPAWSSLAVLVVGAALLRIIPWLANFPLHRDEALYGAWARLLLSGRDPALLTVYVDKPPLVIYLLAGSMGLFGASEYALRLPGLLASIATLPVTFALARRLLSARAALLTVALLAASPFAILFAPTAFTDPWLTLWIIAGAWAAVAGRPLLAGLFVGLAIASKQTGVLAAPLVVALMATSRPRSPLKDYLLLLAGCALVVAPVLWWDSLRWATRPGFWTRSLETYGGLHLTAPGDWPARAESWARQAGYLYGRPWLTGVAVALAAAGLYQGRRETRAGVSGVSGEALPPAGERVRSGALWAIGGYCAAYLALHVTLSFQPWDRYLLPLAPLLALLAGAGAEVLRWDGYGRGRPAARAALALFLAGGAYLGSTGQVPVGSDHGAYAGMDQVVAAVREMPWSAVVYQRSLGWHLDFYLFDCPPPHIWWDSSATLADDAEYGVNEFPGREQWLILAEEDSAAGAEARRALAGRGLAMLERRRVYRPDGTQSFGIYQILPQPELAGDGAIDLLGRASRG